ncbi:MAG: putative LPS assembly protein LptD, partial [candidate division Zixibacteria bacterium]|nr:putative LPS assembly protein LptD [candidate division Zixibacteria bacterium]
LNYPDQANLVTISGDTLIFLTDARVGIAKQKVTIDQKETHATCDSAQFILKDNRLILSGSPRAVQGESDIRGKDMEIRFAHGQVERINVVDSATALFVEKGQDKESELSGKSRLSGKQITFYFKDGEIRKIAADGAARSDYFPAPDDTTGAGKNFVSGDSIFIYVQNQKTEKIEVKGGAEGVYITKVDGGDTTAADTSAVDTTITGIPGANTLAKADTSWDRFSGGQPGDTLGAPGDTLGLLNWPYQDSIHYRGGYLEFFVAERIIRMTGNSIVRQKTVTLDAHQIDYNIPKRVALAKARVDSVGDSTHITPLALKDGSEEIFGSQLVYNVDTKKGLIENATTEYERSYYTGKDLYKEEEKVFYVEDGTLSSCDLPEPHFHFSSRKMKMMNDDKAVARPVTLYIETVPVMVVPYYIFPLKRGRHSGILPLRLGNFERGNRYLGNIGYYWAASEYWDLQSSLDFYENIGTTFNGVLRYNKRYGFSGQVQGSYARERREAALVETRKRQWALSGSHRQTLPYNIGFSAYMNFASSSYYTDYSTNPDERRNRSLTSKANFNKQFGKASLSLSFNNTNNLDTDSRTSQLPSGSLTMPQFQPFGSGREVDGKTIKKWYNEFYLGYNNNFALSLQNRKLTDGTRSRKEYGYVHHNLSMTASQKAAKYLNLSFRLSSTETWYRIMRTNKSEEMGIPADFYRRGSITGGLGANTNLYGTFPVGFFGLQALRHVLTPTVGFSWAPAVTKNDTVKQYTGPGGGGNRQMTMSLDITQLFQAKVKSGDKEAKYDLLRVSSGAGYNFESTGRKLSDLSTSFSTALGKINLNGSIEHDLYDTRNKIRFWKPRLKSFSISSSFQGRGSVSDNYVSQGLGASAPEDSSGFPTLPGEGFEAPTSSAAGTAWNFSVSHRYSESGHLTGEVSRTHWVQLTFNMDLTANWKIKYHQNYDLVAHETTEKVIDLYRRLHCWEAHFYWIPEGSRKGYYFKINVIAVPDIKLEKSESGLRGALLD